MVGEPVADDAVAYLVMILCEYYKLAIGIAVGMTAKTAFAMGGIVAIIDIRISECFFEMGYIPEVFIISVGLPGQKGTQRVVKLVNPLSVEAVSPFRGWVDITGIIEVYFGDELFFTVAAAFDVHDFLFQLLHNVYRTEIPDSMYGVESQGVDMIIFQPHPGILKEVITHSIGPGVIEIERVSPASLVFVCEIGAKLTEVIAFRPKMIVDHIDDNSDTPGVCGIDEGMKTRDTAIGILYGERIHAIVTPVAFAGKLRQGHELDGIDAQQHQVVKSLEDALEIMGRGESAGM